MFIDSHFHTNVYNRFENALEQALAILDEHKILVVSSSTDPDSYQQTLEIATKSKYFLPCFGIHPQVALRSMPNYIFEMVAKIVSVRNISQEKLVELTNKNFHRLIQDDKLLEVFFH
ncbi:MAG: TatD family hydrolase [Candidatus Heimdallarchaeota archaeon]